MTHIPDELSFETLPSFLPILKEFLETEVVQSPVDPNKLIFSIVWVSILLEILTGKMEELSTEESQKLDPSIKEIALSCEAGQVGKEDALRLFDRLGEMLLKDRD